MRTPAKADAAPSRQNGRCCRLSLLPQVRVWSWTGRTRRHTVQFRHNTFSGSQLLEVDGVTIHRTRFQYKLTGCLVFEVGGTTVELYILADDIGALTYRLTLDGKELSPEAKRAVSTWVVRASDGLHQVEFEVRGRRPLAPPTLAIASAHREPPRLAAHLLRRTGGWVQGGSYGGLCRRGVCVLL